MSWQIGSMVVLMLALGSGMIWYERSRPPSQIVALVAVLAALAVAGRIVLAPIPNVVATTDIVFFSGFVLGPAPGFAVGALGGLVSNFWLGQGVWTPWQMAGWGMTGVAGGGLWYLTRGRANRFTLAIACGAAGLAFGAWMNFQTMVSFGGEMSLDRYLALEVRAIPFDLAHITGNVIFALAVGPAMIAALRRFRERFEWRQVTSTVGGLLVAVALVTVVTAPSAKAATSDETELAAGWLRAQQNNDGGFATAPGGSSSVGMTARAMLGLAAAKVNPLDVVTNKNDPMDYLVAKRKKLDDSADLALVILACETVGKDPRKFHGRDLLTALNGRGRRGRNYSYHNRVNTAAFAAMAFKSAGAKPAKKRVVDWLISVQNPKTGGWGISDSAKSDPDSTGTVLQIIHGKKNIRPAMKFLNKTQKTSGGWVSGSTVNSQSTALALQGAMGAGKGRNYLRRSGHSGLDYLHARQADNGSIWYSKVSDQTRVWVTSDALIAIAGETLPVEQPKREPKPKDDTTSGSNTGGASPPAGSTTTPNLYDSSSAGSTSPNSSGGNGADQGSGNPFDNPGSSSGQGRPDSGNGSSPADTGELPLETDVPVIPVAPSAALLAASQQGPQPSPVIAVLICLLVAGGLAGGTALLARRFKW